VVPAGIKCPDTKAPGEIWWRPAETGGKIRRDSSITAFRYGRCAVVSPLMLEGSVKAVRISRFRWERVEGFLRR
jgi:hypothetical protein